MEMKRRLALTFSRFRVIITVKMKCFTSNAINDGNFNVNLSITIVRRSEEEPKKRHWSCP